MPALLLSSSCIHIYLAHFLLQKWELFVRFSFYLELSLLYYFLLIFFLSSLTWECALSYFDISCRFKEILSFRSSLIFGNLSKAKPWATRPKFRYYKQKTNWPFSWSYEQASAMKDQIPLSRRSLSWLINVLTATEYLSVPQWQWLQNTRRMLTWYLPEYVDIRCLLVRWMIVHSRHV